MMLLPPDKVRMGAGLINIMQQGIGGTVGLATMTTLLERYTAYRHTMLDQQQVASSLGWGESFAPARALLLQHLQQETTVAAYQDCFVLVALLCVVVTPLVLFLRRQSAE